MSDWQSRLTRLFFRNVDGTGDGEWSWPPNTQRENWNRIEFESDDATLVGVFGEATGAEDPSGAVVLAHPNRVAAKGYFLRSKLPGTLRDAGYDVFAFDFNGYGESEEGSIDYYPDIINAVDTIDELSDSSITAVLGVSLGGAYLIPALAELDDDAVDAAIFDSVYPTTREFLWPDDLLQWAGLRVGELFNATGTRPMSPIKYAADVTAPDELLFIYGEDDSHITSDHQARLLGALPHGDDDIDHWVASQTRHNTAMRRHPETYERKVCEYIERRASYASP